MRVLIACEFSGIVREAFRARGHDAVSCDLLPSETPGPHIQGYALETLGDFHRYGRWDMVLAFPPCTHLAVSGARWFKDKQREQSDAIEFFLALAALEVPHVAIENPIGIMSTEYRKPDQIVHPFMFGHPETKATCLWLKNLPKLIPTHDVREAMAALPAKQQHRVHYASPGPDRWKNRSRTLQGIATAMAQQWGDYVAQKVAA